MRKIYLLGIILFLCFQSFAQITNDEVNSRIQIGTRLNLQYGGEDSNNWVRGLVSSTIKWNLETDMWDIGYHNLTDFSMMKFSNGGNIVFYTRSNIGNNYSLSNSNLSDYARLIISSSGNIGIGTIIPSHKLDVKGDLIGFPATSGTTQTNGIYRIESNSNLTNVVMDFGIHGGDNASNWIQATNKKNLSWNYSLLLNPNGGKVGIGVFPDEMKGNHKLYVDGTIMSTEIKVNLKTNWSDFVFNDEYKLKDINEIELFIKENKHLPDIPTAEEVEENGINLGDMNAKLLQKIEELTLYMIDLNNEIENLKDKNKELEDKLNIR